MEHITVQPAQAQTDYMLVFTDDDQFDLSLIAQVEVPRFSQPNRDGVRLSEDKRLALAAHRAVEMDVDRDPDSVLIMQEIGEDYERVGVEDNPAFDAVWNPEYEKYVEAKEDVDEEPLDPDHWKEVRRS